MSEKEVKKYLDDLLVELEIFGKEEKKRNTINKQIIETVNFYKDTYPKLIIDYKEKGNKF